MTEPEQSPTPTAPMSRSVRTCRTLGYLSFLFGPLTGIPGIILGVREINRSEGHPAFRVAAISGIVRNAVGSILIAGMIACFTLYLNIDRRIESSGHLMCIDLALMSEEATEGHFPVAIYSKDGKPLLSWRVMLLPNLEYDDLYKEFHLDEPWDSSHNIKLLSKMPDIYRNPRFQSKSERESGLTYYQGFSGPGTVFDVNHPEGVSATTISNHNGPSNTFLVVEAGEPVPWTKPQDILYSSSGPLPNLAEKRGLFCAGFVDGHTEVISLKEGEDRLRSRMVYRGKMPAPKER